MTRPNRYPYTKNQWEERTVDYYTYDGEVCFSQRVLENRLTGELRDDKF